MSILGIIIVVVLCLVLAIALFFEIRGLVKALSVYKTKKKLKEGNKVSEESKEDK